MREYFETRTRADGSSYVTLTDGRPDWLYEAVQEAHDGELPDDWRYSTCESIAELIDGGATDPATIADSLTDVYNASLLEWYRDNLNRMGYVDEAMEDGLEMDTLGNLLMLGQYRCIEQMAQVLIDAHEANQDES